MQNKKALIIVGLLVVALVVLIAVVRYQGGQKYAGGQNNDPEYEGSEQILPQK